MKKIYRTLLAGCMGIVILTVLSVLFTYICKDMVYGFIIASTITGAIVNYYLIEKDVI